MQRRHYVVALVVVLAAALLVPATATAKTTKVDVCHLNVFGEWQVNSVKDGRAVDAHLAHGDALPGQVVPDMAGYTFDDDCVPVAVALAAGCYSSGEASFHYYGPINTLDNVSLYATSDCSGTPASGVDRAVIQAADSDEAVSIMLGLGTYTSFICTNLATTTPPYPVPDDIWGCLAF